MNAYSTNCGGLFFGFVIDTARIGGIAMSNINDASWYYSAGNEQKGPVSTGQMQALIGAGAVGPQTLVWAADMENWAPLAESALGPFARPVAPPPPPPLRQPGAAGYAAQPAAARSYGSAQSFGAAPSYGAAQSYGQGMSFGAAIISGFQKYATFSGRASRSEFWYYILFVALVGVVLTTIDLVVFLAIFGFELQPLSTLFSLGTLVPNFAVSVRRLHDTQRSGWWNLIVLVPLVGLIVLIVFWAQRGTEGQNKFG